MASGIEAELIDLLAVFIVAGGVGVAVAKIGDIPYTIALLITGLGASIAGVSFGIELSHDIIILVLLPPLLFEGAATTNLEAFRRNFLPIVLLAVPGLLVSITILGVVTHLVLGLPLLVSLLFAVTVLPTDPVSVLALFEELGAPERLSVLVEGESLINDGVGVVVFGALLTLVEQGATIDALLTSGGLLNIGTGIVFSSAGGALVGLAVGYLVYGVMRNLDEQRTEVVLTIVVAYGSFLFAEHFLGVSGVVATVAAGIFIGNRGAEYAMSPQTRIGVFRTWETGAYIVNTYIFIAIGALTPISQLIDNALFIGFAIVLVLVARAFAVYPFAALANTRLNEKISIAKQHVMLWGGLHGSIPVALALGIPATINSGAPFPFREEIRAMVFGVAAFSLIVQGLTMGSLLERLGIVTESPSERLYDLLVGRAKLVSDALDAASSLNERGEISDSLYNQFKQEYTAEKNDLADAIGQLLNEHPELRKRQKRDAERRLLMREKSSLLSASRRGEIEGAVAEQLTEELDIKIDQVNRGQTTISGDGDEQEYEEFWREEARDFGLTLDDEEDDTASDGTESDNPNGDDS